MHYDEYMRRRMEEDRAYYAQKFDSMRCPAPPMRPESKVKEAYAAINEQMKVKEIPAD